MKYLKMSLVLAVFLLGLFFFYGFFFSFGMGGFSWIVSSIVMILLYREYDIRKKKK